jgi:prepilin-type N-terminal cleavage/methylation domain-containing protein
MTFARRSRRGFSLTEILMAVGILGVGMTMVASIFPVAVDQTRRANDTTMAALCARSIAATIRANRTRFVTAHHGYFMGLITNATYVNDAERPAEFGIQTASATVGNPGILYGTADNVISKSMRVYNPNMFVYDGGKRYDVYAPGTMAAPSADPYWPMWNAGNYVPVIYVTPIVPPDKRANNLNDSSSTGLGGYNVDGGPWRVTIVVFKSRGHAVTTARPQGDALHPRLKSWYQNATSTTAGEPTFAAGAGNYVIDRGKHGGECYMIDFANLDDKKTIPADGGTAAKGNLTNPPLLLACGISAEARKYAPTTVDIPNNAVWYPLPGAVAAFHTVIGD